MPKKETGKDFSGLLISDIKEAVGNLKLYKTSKIT